MLQLNDLAFDELAQGGHGLHERLALRERAYHFERAGKRVVPTEHAGGVRPDDARRIDSAAQVGVIDHVIVQQAGQVHQLSGAGQAPHFGPRDPHTPGRQQRQNRPNAFAAGADQVHPSLDQRRNRLPERLWQLALNGLQLAAQKLPQSLDVRVKRRGLTEVGRVAERL